MIEQISSEMKPITFDVTPCLNSTIDDLDVQLFEAAYPNGNKMIAAKQNKQTIRRLFTSVLKQEKQEKQEKQAAIKQTLASLGWYDMGNDCPTVAGILLIGKDPTRFLFGAYIQYVKFEGRNRASKILDEKQFSGNFITMLPKIDSFIKHEEQYSILKELLMNNIMHRNYQTNSPSKFYEYADRIEIDNPGNLYGTVNAGNFPHETDYRNPVLSQALKELGYANRFGCGINMVQNTLKGQIVFDIHDSTTFKVTVLKSGSEPQNSIIEKVDHTEKNKVEKHEEDIKIEQPKLNMQGLSDKQKIVEYMKENPKISTGKLSKLMDLPIGKVQSLITELKVKKILEHVGGKNNGFWKVIENATEKAGEKDVEKETITKTVQKPDLHNLDLTDEQKKTIEYMSENPRISISKLATLIGITPAEVKDIVSTLKARGFIERIGKINNGYWKIMGKNAKMKKDIFAEQQLIVEQIKKDPFISFARLSENTGITVNAIQLSISELKAQGVLERIGSKKSGYWKVNEKDAEKDKKTAKETLTKTDPDSNLIISKLPDEQKKILEYIKKDSKTTSTKISNLSGMDIHAVRYHILKLKEKGILEHIGATNKSGEWKIKEPYTEKKEEKQAENRTEKKQEEQAENSPKKNHEDDPSSTHSINTLSRRPKEIVQYMEADPHVTTKKLAELINISIDTVKDHILRLKKKGIVERMGSPYNGYWKVNRNNVVEKSVESAVKEVKKNKNEDAKIMASTPQVGDLSENQKKILNYIEENPHIKAKELATLIGVSDGNIKTHYGVLQRKGLLERVGSQNQHGYWKVNKQDAEQLKSTEQAVQKSDIQGMNLPNKQKKILEYMSENPRIMQKELSSLINTNLTNIRNHISSLRAKGLVERVGGNSAGFWQVKKGKEVPTQKDTENLQGQDKDLSEIQKKILKHIKEDPYIKQDTLAALVGVRVDGIEYHISTLKEKNIIERIGEKKDGYWKIRQNEPAAISKTTAATPQVSNLTDRKIKILEYIKQNPHITVNKLADLVGVSPATIRLSIDLLKEEENLKHIGTGKSGYWQLDATQSANKNHKSDINTPQKREFAIARWANRQKQIIEHINKNPHITLNELAALTNVSAATMRTDMDQLKAKGMIKRIDGNKKIGYWQIMQDADGQKKTVSKPKENSMANIGKIHFNAEAILDHIEKNPYTSAFKLSKVMGGTQNQMVYVMRKLRSAGLIERISADTGNYWKIAGKDTVVPERHKAKDKDKKPNDKLSGVKKKILKKFKKYPDITADELSDMLGIPLQRVEKLIFELQEAGMIEYPENEDEDYQNGDIKQTTEEQTAEYPKEVKLLGYQKRILEYIKKNPQIKLADLTDVMGISTSWAKINLFKLQEAGLLEHVGNGRNSQWTFVENYVEIDEQNNGDSTDGVSELQKNILKHIKKNPRITVKQLSILTNVSMSTIQTNTTILRSIGILEKVGTPKYWKIIGERLPRVAQRQVKNKKNKYENLTDMKQKLLEHIENNPYLSVNKLSILLKTTHRSIKIQLNQLREKGILERTGRGDGGRWTINKDKIDKMDL